MLLVYLYAISMTCAKLYHEGGSINCFKEQEHINYLGSFATVKECEDTLKFFQESFEYATPTTRARLFCRDTGKKKK
jgi:hypothetical protein